MSIELAYSKLSNQYRELQEERDIFKRTLDKRDMELETERMSAEKTYDHNNRLINEVDRYKEALERMLTYNTNCPPGYSYYAWMDEIAREALGREER